ncbi:MAG TPA: response regulator, partial [Burkholderiaceae bacterium]|nr:response regulator [Burkholderiaceae bacterium]
GEVVLLAQALAEDPGHQPGVAAMQLRFAVRDTGVGMRPEMLEQLFAPVPPVQLLWPRRAGGVGVGLALCRRLAELMGGNISASSRIGEGSAFRLDVPLPLGDAPGAASCIGYAPSLAGRRVLIAEDNATNRRFLSEQLTALAMDCAIAENGRQALQMLRIAANSASRFDVAVVDRSMPFMDGAELVERIRSDPTLRTLRVIMLTSIAGPEDASLADTGGVDAYLAKPVARQNLVDALVTVIGSQPAERGASTPESVASTSALAPAVLPVVVAGHALAPDRRPNGTGVPLRKVLEKRVLDEILTMERNGAKDLLRRLIATYESSSKSLLRDTDLALANQDAAAVVQALHTLKRSSADVGASRFARSCSEIEALARQQHLPEVQMRWQALRAEHENVLLALQALLPPAVPSADAPLQELER